jgi:PAS domain S-box-containing protein
MNLGDRLRHNRRALFSGLLAFSVLATATAFLARERYLHSGYKRSQEALAAAAEQEGNLENVLSEVNTATTTLSLIAARYGTGGDFDSVADQILQANKSIDGVGIVVKKSLTHYRARFGRALRDTSSLLHKLADGHNKTGSPGIDFASIHRAPADSILLAARTPIRRNDSLDAFAVAILSPEKLFSTSDKDSRHLLQLSLIDTATGEEQFLLHPPQPFDTAYAGYLTISPATHLKAWRIYVMPRKHSDLIPWLLIIAGLVVSVFGGVLVWYVMTQPARLNRLVAQKVAELGIAESKYEVLLGQLQSFFENVAGAAYLLDAQKRYVIFNRKFVEGHKRITGLEPKAGMEAYTHYPAAMKAKRDEAMERVLRGKREVIETAYTDKGRHRHYRTSFSPVMCDGAVVGISVYSTDLTNIKEVEHELRRANASLHERIKELKCLYRVSELTNNDTASMQQILQEVVHILPAGWQYPEIAHAKIKLDAAAYYTDNFREGKWQQEAAICSNGNTIGSVSIYYTEQMPEEDEGPFLADERSLINSIAEMIGSAVDRKLGSDEVVRLGRLYQFSSAINEAMLRAGDEATIYKEACRIAIDHGAYRMAWIGLIDVVKERIAPFAVCGHEAGFLTAVKASLNDETLRKIPSVAAMRTRTYQYCNDISADPAMLPWREEALRREYRASMSLPVIVDGELVALFTLYRSKAYSFTDTEIKLLSGVTENIAYAIENLRIKETKRLYVEKLSESEELFRKLTEETPVGVYIVQDGKFSYVNPGFEEITGYSSAQLIGLAFEKFIYKEDVEKVWNGYLSCISGQQPTNQYLFRGLRKDGAVRHIQLIISLIKYHGQAAILGTAIDITSSVEEEKRFNMAVSEAQENERLIIGMELHDSVKQMMATSLLSLYMTKTSLDDKTLANQHLDNAQFQIREAVAELRKISHQLAPSLDASIPFAEKVTTLVAGMNVSEALNVSFDFSYSEPVCNNLQLAFYRIIQEQFANILKHAHATCVRISIIREGGRLILSIADNGVGFDRQKHKAGIGLVNIKRRAKALEGKVQLTTAPQKGCTLTVSVPTKSD